MSFFLAARDAAAGPSRPHHVPPYHRYIHGLPAGHISHRAAAWCRSVPFAHVECQGIQLFRIKRYRKRCILHLAIPFFLIFQKEPAA